MSAIKVEGMEEYLRLLDLNYKQLERMCGRSLYPGAKVIANDCKKRLQNLRTDDTYAAYHGGFKRGLTRRQKTGLIESLGIAKIRRKGGGFDVKLGFDGYNDVVTDRWPKGQPNMMIARSVNKGTSFMEAQPFMDQCIEAKRAEVEEAIEQQFYKELGKYWDRK